MAPDTPQIDPYLFECQCEAFRKFIEEQSGSPFESFASNAYIQKKEGYKLKIYYDGRDALAFDKWKKSAIGSRKIAQAVVNAIEIPKNNLVPWQTRYGKEARPHQPLCEAEKQQDNLLRIERCLFALYREQQEKSSFDELIDVFGKTYPLLAYLFFLKDYSRYLPIAPTFFDRAFELLGVEFKTSHQCSWENYQTYISLIRELKIMLAESLDPEATLLDAHSFAWILAAQMWKANKTADIQVYLNLPSSERESIVKARIGQVQFRQSLIEYWSTCAVTGCKEESLLRASHIKPWNKATLEERLDLYNGLLLSPALDACFDSGYVSFDDQGRILISERLTADDAEVLGISSTMHLRRVEPKHKKYLAFHREHIFSMKPNKSNHINKVVR